MKTQKKLLIVTNLLNKSHLNKICHFCTSKGHSDIDIHIAYVVPIIPSYYLQIPSLQSLQDTAEEKAKDKLHEVGDDIHISKENIWLLHGSIRWAAHTLAEKLNIHNVILEGNTEDINKALHSLRSKKTKIDNHSIELLNATNSNLLKKVFL